MPQKKFWLARVGYEMQRRRTLAKETDGEASAFRGKAESPDSLEILVESGDVLAWLAAEMERGGATVGVDSPEEFLDFVGRRSGLFLPRAEGRYAFIHLSFQEYFAAVALERDVTGIDWARGKSSPLGFVRDDLARWAEQSAWRETFVFLFELLAPKNDWYAELLDCVFGDEFSRLDAPEPDERTLNLACLAARLVVNPRAGLAPAKTRDAIDGCVRTQLRYQSAESYDRVLSDNVFRELLGDDREWNAKMLDAIGEQLRKLGIRGIDLSMTRIDDIAPLADLIELQSLSLWRTTVSDLTPLANLTALQRIDLDGTLVSDLSPLSNLTALESLELGGTSVSDLTPLSNLTGLQRLYLMETKVSDLSPLANLTALESLGLGGASVSDLSPLANLTALESLELGGASVSDLTSLSNLTGLQSLGLWRTTVSDLTPLSNLTGLQSLSLWGTKVSDLTPLSNLTGLQLLYLMETKISDLTPLSNLTGLQSLYLMETKVSDLTPLSNLTGLQSLSLWRTTVSDLTPLANLTKLKSLGLTGTEITENEVRKLRDTLPHCHILT